MLQTGHHRQHHRQPGDDRPKRTGGRQGAGACCFFFARGVRAHIRGTAPADYGTVAVDRGPIEQVVNATGTVNPVTTVQVGTYVSGPIQALDVWFNSPVKKGQRVAKIDPAPFAVKVREAEASLKNAQA